MDSAIFLEKCFCGSRKGYPRIGLSKVDKNYCMIVWPPNGSSTQVLVVSVIAAPDVPLLELDSKIRVVPTGFDSDPPGHYQVHHYSGIFSEPQSEIQSLAHRALAATPR